MQTSDNVFQVERSHANLLLIFGGDDECTDRLAAEYIPRRLAMHGSTNKCEVIVYPGAGHLIEPPHSCNCISSHQPVMGMFKNYYK